MTHVIGENTPDEMAMTPDKRPIKVGTTITLGAATLMMMLNEFADRFMDAIGNTADEDGQCHPDQVDVMHMAQVFTCEKIREQWNREWEEKQKKEQEKVS